MATSSPSFPHPAITRCRGSLAAPVFRPRGVLPRAVASAAAPLRVGPPAEELRMKGIEMDAAVERELREKGYAGVRRTKLVCTLGPACCSVDGLVWLADAGMNVARLNMCHNTREWHRGVIRALKRLNEERGFCVSIMMDTEGSQVHMVDHGGMTSIKAEDGSTWLFTTEQYEGLRPFTVKAMDQGFSEGIMVGDDMVIEGGMATFKVVEKFGNDLRCKCTDHGLLLPRAKLSFWRSGKLIENVLKLPSLSAKDWSDIEFGISEDVDFIAVSFVKDANDIKLLKNYLLKRSSDIKVLAKIESLESLENLEEIVKASDGVMIARGDLGVQVPLEQIPSIQEEVTHIGRKLNKPVILASQLLESMIEYPIPTRAEVSDVSEAVRQRADALMLSGESAVGMYAEKALSVLHTTSLRMESWGRRVNRDALSNLPLLSLSLPDQIAEQICNCAVDMANRLEVDAICVYTRKGHMASLLSRNCPDPPIFAFTDNAHTRRALSLQWGVVPLELPLSGDVENDIRESFHHMKARGIMKAGDVLLVVSDLNPSPSEKSIFQSVQVRTVV